VKQLREEIERLQHEIVELQRYSRHLRTVAQPRPHMSSTTFS
jgi:hypothetical protein